MSLDPAPVRGRARARRALRASARRWAEMTNLPPEDPRHQLEFLHRQMNEEVNGLEIAARNLADFPDADWELRMAIARQCWDEARHVVMFRRCYERRGRPRRRSTRCSTSSTASPPASTRWWAGWPCRTAASRPPASTPSRTASARRARPGPQDLVELLDTQLADEVQHVRYANEWVKRLVERGGPEATFKMVRAVSQAGRGHAAGGGRGPHLLSGGGGRPARGRLRAGRDRGGQGIDPPRLTDSAPVTEGSRPGVDLVEGEGLAAVASLWRKTGRELRARFGGSSMLPALPPGTEVLLRCGETGAVGDVIAFLADGRLVVHRVVARAGDGTWTLTRGDARLLPDAPIRDAEAIVGRVAGICGPASLQAMPAAPDSLVRRSFVRLFSAALRISPGAGAAALRSVHAGLRLARTVPLLLRRSPGP